MYMKLTLPDYEFYGNSCGITMFQPIIILINNNLYVRTVNHYYMEWINSLKKTIRKQRVLLSLILILSGLIITAVFFIELLFEGFLNFNTINFNRASDVGEFIGGVVGTIFTLVGIVLLYETLSLQRNEFEDSRKVFEKQQFENKFFSLLKLYQEIITTFHYDLPASSQKFVGKEFFIQHRNDFIAGFSETNSYFKNRKSATANYIAFYLNNKEVLGQYFRTVYRLLKLIQDSKNSAKEKVEYVKIIRGQLSESELFFLHYNAYTEIGKKSREFLLSYNLLKHLPLLEKVEFKYWKSKLTLEKINSVSIIFDELLIFLKSDLTKFHKVYLRGRFDLKVEKSDYKVELVLMRNNSVTYSSYVQEGYGLDDFNNNELESLLKFWGLETFDFRKYPDNPNSNLLIKVDNRPNGNFKSIISCNIKNKDNSKLLI